MSHFSKEEWTLYINDQLDQAMRESCEDHLYVCEECLGLYLECLERSATALPAIEYEERFIEQTLIAAREAKNLTSIEHTTKNIRKKSQEVHQARRDRSIFHYTVAAVVTIMLMSTGIFQEIVQAKLATTAEQVERQPFSEKLMQQAVRVLDAITPSAKGGK